MSDLTGHEHSGGRGMGLVHPDEVKRLRRKLQFHQEWYSVRWQRIIDELRDTEVWPRVACIMANGTADPNEPPTYAQQMNILRGTLEGYEREVIGWAREAGVPLMSPPRVPEAAQAMCDEIKRLRDERDVLVDAVRTACRMLGEARARLDGAA